MARPSRRSGSTLELLPELTDADLEELGLPLGPRKKLLKAIAGRDDAACARSGHGATSG